MLFRSQAEKYTQEKLNTMLFSTVVDPHWFQKGNNFWFEYKTSEGTFWYVVDPAARTKKLLFDRDELASQLTEIVKDPFEARHLPITNLKAEIPENIKLSLPENDFVPCKGRKIIAK